MSNLDESRGSPSWYGEAAQSIAPVGILMAGFMPVYSIWFGFAWGAIGWVIFALTLLISIFIARRSVENYKHAKTFVVNKSEAGVRIGKEMGRLSLISYSALWIVVIILLLTGHYKYIFPSVTFIIALHFFPQAKIFSRSIDYYIAPFPLLSSIVAFMFASQTNVSWLEVYAIAGSGGVVSTAAYGVYMLISYKNLSRIAGILPER